MKHMAKTPVLPGRIVRNNGATEDQSDRSKRMNFNGLEHKSKQLEGKWETKDKLTWQAIVSASHGVSIQCCHTAIL